MTSFVLYYCNSNDLKAGNIKSDRTKTNKREFNLSEDST